MAFYSLIDYVFEKSDLAYLSDIHYSKNYKAISMAVNRLDATKYSIDEWNSLISYIVGHDVCFQTVEDAHQFLLDLPALDKPCEEH